MQKRIVGIITRLIHHPHHHHHHHRRAPPDQMVRWACQDLQDQMDQKAPRDPRDFPDHPAYQDTQETPPGLPEDRDLWDHQDQPAVKAHLGTWEQWDPPGVREVSDNTWVKERGN